MANQEHLEILKQGVEVWNRWREVHPKIWPDLSGSDHRKANLNGADLNHANLKRANLSEADLNHANLYMAELIQADLSKANLCDANLYMADLRSANLVGADLQSASLSGGFLMAANLRGANLRGANLVGTHFGGTNLSDANLFMADLSAANMSDADLSGANLSSCRIYGISAWNVQLKNTIQTGLIITHEDEPSITVDNLEVAQFVYLLLNNPKIRDVIDTIAKKAVLILGRFTSERKAVLDALKQALRTHDYLPIVFDFDKPSSQDLTETVSTLAHLSRFIVVDLSDPSSAPYEVGTIASNHIKPIQAIFHPSDEAKRVFAMFPDLIMRYHWVLPPYKYQDQEHLLASLEEHVIEPAERKAKELARLRAQEFLK